MAPKRKPKNLKSQRALNEEVFLICFYLAKNDFSCHETEELGKGTSPILVEIRMEKSHEKKERTANICGNFRFAEKLQR